MIANNLESKRCSTPETVAGTQKQNHLKAKLENVSKSSIGSPDSRIYTAKKN